MKLIALLAASAAAFVAVPASAATITYTFSGNFQGTISGNPFDVAAVFTGVGDTNTVSDNGFALLVPLTSLTALSGGTTFTILSPALAYRNINNYVGLAFDGTGSGFFSGNNAALAGYDMVSNFPTTPIGFFNGGGGASFLTDQGAVTITGANSGTFSAVVSGAVPEPATWAMMIGGIGAVGGALRRRAKVRTTVRFA